DCAGVSERDERIAAQVARVVLRHVEAVVSRGQRRAVALEPIRKTDVRLGAVRQRILRTTLLDAAVPGTDVLTDVASVNLRAQLGAVLLGYRGRRLRPVGEALRRIHEPRLVERAGRT